MLQLNREHKEKLLQLPSPNHDEYILFNESTSKTNLSSCDIYDLEFNVKCIFFFFIRLFC